MLKRAIRIAIVLSCSLSVFADYVSDREAAVKLVKGRKYEEALAAFKKMSEGKVTDFQESDALEQAALCLNALKRYSEAMKIAKTIPIEPMSKTMQMRILSSSRKCKELHTRFKDQDIDAWPDHVKAHAFTTRGKCAARVKDAKLAVADLTKALAYTTKSNDKGNLLNALGGVYRDLVKDDDKAIEVYRRTFRESHTYKQSHAAIAVAGILLRRGKPEDAQKELRRIDHKKMRGYWRAVMLAAHGRVLAAMGKKEKAIAHYAEAMKVKGASAHTVKTCKTAIDKLQGKGK